MSVVSVLCVCVCLCECLHVRSLADAAARMCVAQVRVCA